MGSVAVVADSNPRLGDGQGYLDEDETDLRLRVTAETRFSRQMNRRPTIVQFELDLSIRRIL